MWQYNYNYGDELYHYGVLGMRWGHRKHQELDEYYRRRRETFVKRQAKAQARSNKYAYKLAQPRSAKRQAKAEKYRAKWQKAEGKARRARMRVAAGKQLNYWQSDRIMRAESLKAKVNRYESPNQKLIAKRSKADYKVKKYQKRIAKIDKKIAKNKMNMKAANRGKKYVKRKRSK